MSTHNPIDQVINGAQNAIQALNTALQAAEAAGASGLESTESAVVGDIVAGLGKAKELVDAAMPHPAPSDKEWNDPK